MPIWLFSRSRAGYTSCYAVQPERTKDQAVDLFNSFHRANVLSPNALLKQHTVTLIYLPCWVFEAHGKLQYTATLGHPGEARSAHKVVTGTGKSVATHATDSFSQVVASYELRRDLANGLKGALKTNAWCPVPRQFSAQDAQALTRIDPKCQTRILPADMHRGIAWALFLRALRQEHVSSLPLYAPDANSKPVPFQVEQEFHIPAHWPLAGATLGRLAEA